LLIKTKVMKIIHKEKQVVCPKIGDTKTIKRFLYFPLTLGNETRWWETANIECEYTKSIKAENVFDMFFSDFEITGIKYYWIKVKFVD